MQFVEIQDAQQFVDNLKYSVQQFGLQFGRNHIVHIGLADKSACDFAAGDLFQRRGTAAIDFGKVCISGKSTCNGLFTAFGLDHRAKPKAGHGAVFHMGAEQIKHTRVGVQQLFKNVYLVNVSHAAFSQMPDKAACVVKSFYVSKIGNSTVFHAAIHHAAAKAACTAAVTGFTQGSLLFCGICPHGQTIRNAGDCGIVNISAEGIQHRGITQLNQTLQHLGFVAVRVCTGYLCHTCHIG